MPPHSPTPSASGAEPLHHAKELLRHLDEPLLAGNRVSLLPDDRAAFDALCGAIDAAADHINIENGLTAPGGRGDELADRLAARCRAGVKVNLLFDSLGAHGTSPAIFERLRASGVALCEYNPLPRWRLWLGQALHLRDHRRLVIVDGRRGFIGGAPVGAVPPPGASPPWRDLQLSVEGPAVNRLQRLFVGHWQRHALCAMPEARYFPPLAPAGRQRVALAAAEAGQRHNPFCSALLGAIENARSRVMLAPAATVPTRRLVRALCDAASRGVAVDLLPPAAGDLSTPLQAGRSHYQALLSVGVRVHERRDRQLQAKACVIDGEWCSVGSSHADGGSVVGNAEADMIVLDREFARVMERVFLDDLAQADTIDPVRWAQQPPRCRWHEALARRVGFLR